MARCHCPFPRWADGGRAGWEMRRDQRRAKSRWVPLQLHLPGCSAEHVKHTQQCSAASSSPSLASKGTKPLQEKPKRVQEAVQSCLGAKPGPAWQSDGSITSCVSTERVCILLARRVRAEHTERLCARELLRGVFLR